MSGPLDGVRVVEVANWTFVPAAGAALADLGADVIKVEAPTGDPQRALRNLLNLDENGPNPFLEVPNRGKRSFTADLTTDEGRKALARVVATADVFMTSNLAPVRKKLGIEVEDIRAANPNIIYVRGTGWGAHGPMADVGGYDVACGWATSGMAYKMTVEQGPLTQPPGFFDLQGANTIAGAVGMALFKRERTGETSVIDVSLMNVGMWATAPDILGTPFSGTHGVGDRAESPNPIVNSYRTGDNRWLYLVCLQADRYWGELCTLLGCPELIDDERFADGATRYANRRECASVRSTPCSGPRPWTRSTPLWTVSAASGPRCSSPMRSRPTPRSSPTGFLPTSITPDQRDPFKLVPVPMRFDDQPTVPRGAAPRVGPAHRGDPAGGRPGLGGDRPAARGRRSGLTGGQMVAATTSAP